LVLKVKRILEFMDKVIKKPTDFKDLEVYEELYTKVKLITLNGVEDSLIPRFWKNTANEMWKDI